MNTFRIKLIIIFIIIFSTVSYSLNNEQLYQNIPVYTTNNLENIKLEIMFEKFHSMKDAEMKDPFKVSPRNSSKDYFIEFFDYFQKPIGLFFDEIHNNYNISDITLYLKKDDSLNIKYIVMLEICVDIDELSYLYMKIDIDYEYSKPLVYSKDINIENLMNQLFSYKLWNVFQTRRIKATPVPEDVEKPKMEDFIKHLNQLKNSKKEK